MSGSVYDHGNGVFSLRAVEVGPDGTPSFGSDLPLAAFDFESIAVDTIVVSPDPLLYAPDGQVAATYAAGYVESGDIRVRTDGGAPTDAVGGGLLVEAGTPIEIIGASNIANLKMVKNSGSAAAVVSLTYYRREAS